MALYALVTPETQSMALAFQFFANIPFAWLTLLAYVTAGLHIQQKYLGLATGLIGSFRTAGGAIGTVILTTILAGKLASELPSRISEATAPLGLPATSVGPLIQGFAAGSPALISAVPGISPQILAAAQSAYEYGSAYAYRITFLSTIPFGVIVCVMSLFIIDPSPFFTRHTSVQHHGRRKHKVTAEAHVEAD